jgi:hypothetical protein
MAVPSRADSRRQEPTISERRVNGPKRMQGVGFNLISNLRPLWRKEQCCRLSTWCLIDFVTFPSAILHGDAVSHLFMVHSTRPHECPTQGFASFFDEMSRNVLLYNDNVYSNGKLFRTFSYLMWRTNNSFTAYLPTTVAGIIDFTFTELFHRVLCQPLESNPCVHAVFFALSRMRAT